MVFVSPQDALMSQVLFRLLFCHDEKQKKCDSSTMSPLLLVREYVFAYADPKKNQISLSFHNNLKCHLFA